MNLSQLAVQKKDTKLVYKYVKSQQKINEQVNLFVRFRYEFSLWYTQIGFKVIAYLKIS